MALIKGIHHVSLATCGDEEYEKTIHFYRDILGMEVVRVWNGGTCIMFSAGSACIEVLNNAESDLPKGAIRHVALHTDSVDDCVAAVRAEGYPITMEALSKSLTSDPPFPCRMAFCLGPVGEEIEFFQER